MNTMKKMSGALLGCWAFAAPAAFAADKLAWDKTFPQSAKVTQQKVSFQNRLGITLVGDMYTPKDLDVSKTYPAIVVGSPYGGVKEQSGGLYAQTLAEKGFVTLAFDASYNGESGGQPRYTSSAEAFVEDFSAAADFIGTRGFVDPNRIGVIGICGSGGFALSAAAVDPRFKAVVTVSMYDMGRATRQGLGDTVTDEQRRRLLEDIAQQRYAEFAGGERTYSIGTVEKLDANSSQADREFYAYYRTKRGQHFRSTTAMGLTGTPAMMNFQPFAHIAWISPRPILFIAGENANSRYFSEDAYALAQQPKELLIIKGAGHVDLYDKKNYIPFEKIAVFFAEHLK